MESPSKMHARHSIADPTPEPPRRRSSFLHLQIPDANWRGSFGHLHFPTFSVTTPEDEPTRRFHFGLGLRRHSHNTLHRSESMVSLCFRSLTGFINDNNFEGLQVFLENKQIQVDDRDENGGTALMLAAAKGRQNFVAELLSHGADPNAEDGDNWTALLCAAKEGHRDICQQLLDNQAEIEHRDMGGWTALMWATYKGHVDVVEVLLIRHADVNAHGNYYVPSLLWASGRGHAQIVELLLHHGAKVNIGDKYGTTALIWASRKGHVDIVKCLLQSGANVDTAGMYSWTALLVATQGNHEEVVNLLLEHKPNVNALDKDGCSALILACKDGYYEIASSLMNVGSYINVQDRAGDTNLIHAVKGGHRAIVEALLKKYADVNITGKDRKTAIYIAVEKGHVAIVKLLLSANPDLEIPTKDGDTPLLKAVRSRNAEIVQLLVDKKAKVATGDKKGDTALHIAMRAQSKAIVEILLRNPKHSHLLYRQNRAGETAYNIDISHEKTILGQIFGARRLNTNEDNENMLGYDLYSSALADILSEPSLSMPITVGLYAKWGSGKSFLLSKLRDEMKNFAREWVDPVFQFTSLLFVIVLHLSAVVGTAAGLSAGSWLLGLSAGATIFLLCYFFLTLIWFSSKRYDWDWPYNFNAKLTRKMNNLKLILQILFCHPPGAPTGDILSAQPIRFYFTDQTRVSSTTGGENSIVQMIGSLYDAIESDYGALSTRLYRAFKPKPVKSSSSWKWRKLCCLPYVMIFEVAFVFLLVGICALTIYIMQMHSSVEKVVEQVTLQAILITTALILGIATVANLYTWTKMFGSLVFSQRRHLQKTICKLDTIKSEGFMQALRHEVNLMKDMVKCIDSLRSQQTRLVIIVDGLDSCEQDKVLLVLDAVHMLFSDSNSPFIVILAIDPHVIAKAVELNSRRVFNDSNIGGHSYLSNMVHLPFYLQNSGLRKVKVAQQTAIAHKKNVYPSASNEDAISVTGRSLSARRLSSENNLMSSTEKLKFGSRKGSRKLKLSESVASSIGSNLNKIGGAQDLTKMLLTDDYFSDVNPRSMRRLMNVVYITGRLLKAFQIDFNWYRLASWINITEQWPFRTSWIIYHYDLYEESLDDNTSLKSLYDKVRPHIPTLKDTEPLLELDRDEHKLDIFLTFHKSSLLVSDLKIFLPFTINLDPYLKKVIKEETQNFEDDGILFGATPRIPMSWPHTPNEWTTHRPAMNRRLRTFTRPNSGPTAVVYPQAAGGVMPWPQPWGDPMAMPSSPQYPLAPVTTLSPDVLDVRLSALNVEGVCKLLDKMDELTSVSISEYKNIIKNNNINGRVLLHCDLDELKNLLKMSFGDWEMFKVVIVSLREHEMTTVMRQDEAKNVRFNVGKTPIIVSQKERRGSLHKAGVSIMTESEGTKLGGDTSSRNKQSVIEKQVTLEEQMICGALQTLNEEACEDIMEETKDTDEADKDVPVTLVVPPSPDGLQDLHGARSRTNSSSGFGDADFVILQNSPIGYWQPVGISVQGNAECLSEQSSRCSTPLQSPVPERRRKHSLKTTSFKPSTTHFESTDPSRKAKHVIIKTDTIDGTKVKSIIYHDGGKPNAQSAHEFKSTSSQTRPSTLQLKHHDKTQTYARSRSKSIDNQQKKRKQRSFEKLHKLKEKFLHSSPDLNENGTDESTPLMSEVSSPTQNSQSNSILMSPLSVKSMSPDCRFDAKKSELNLTDVTELSPVLSYRDTSFCNASKFETNSCASTPEKVKSRVRTMSECTDVSVSLLGPSPRLKSASNASLFSKNSHSSLQLSRQDAVDSEENLTDVYCDPTHRL